MSFRPLRFAGTLKALKVSIIIHSVKSIDAIMEEIAMIF